MYRIDYIGARRRRRLISDTRLHVEDFRAIERDLGLAAKRARKTSCVAARKTAGGELIETRWNGKETEARPAPGDWIVTTLGADGVTPLRDEAGETNVYVIGAARFGDLYEPAGATTPHGDIYRPRGVVEALRLTGGFEILAPWGEAQRAADGWLLLNGDDVYGNHRGTFAATYELLD